MAAPIEINKVNDEEIINIDKDFANKIMSKPPLFTLPTGTANILKAIVLFPARLALLPVTTLIGAVTTRALTWGGNGEADFTIESQGLFQKPITVKTNVTQRANEKLSINVHGVGGNSEGYSAVAEQSKRMLHCDQWSINRYATFTVEGQKEQIRRVILAAIMQGYKDIRLDGFSYGAGLVRAVYHDLMQDETFRAYMQVNSIKLHYTARNGYESEVLLAAGFLQRYGSKKDKNYVTDSLQTIPKPSIFMRLMNYLHELPLFNITLRNKPISGYDIPKESRNYVVNAVINAPLKANAKNDIELNEYSNNSQEARLINKSKHVLRDGIIQYTNRTNDIEKYGHTCLDVAVDVSELTEDFKIKKSSDRHCVALDEIVNDKINRVIFRQTISSEEKAKEKLNQLMNEIVEKEWQVSSVGGKKVSLDIKVEDKVEKVNKTVPNTIKKVTETYQKAKEGEMSWDQALRQVGLKIQQAAQSYSLTRDSSTQRFYEEKIEDLKKPMRPS